MSLLLKVSGKAALTYVIDGSGVPIETGLKGHLQVPFNCRVERVILLADGEDSIQVDIWRSTLENFPPSESDSITGGNAPRISFGDSYEDAELEDWERALNEGDILAFNVDSVGGPMGFREDGGPMTRVTVSLQVRKT